MALLRENNSSSRVLFNKDFKQVKVFPGEPIITSLYAPYYKLSDRRKEGLIDSLGNTIIPAEYEQLRFVSGRVLAAKKNNRYGLLDVQGNIVAPFLYDDILSETGKNINALYNDMRRHQEVFVEINEQSAVQLVLKCNVVNYPKLAQDFYNLRHTIRCTN